MKIKTRIILAIMLAVSLSIAGVTITVSNRINKNFTTNFAVNGKAQIELMNAFVNIFFGIAKSNMEQFSDSLLLDQDLTPITKYFGNNAGQSSKISEIERRLAQEMSGYATYFPMIQVMYTATADGGIVMSPNTPLPANFDPRTRDWYKSAVNAGKIIFTPVYLSTEGMMVCSVVGPLMSPNNSLLGVASIDISLDRIAKETGSVRIGETGYIFVLDATGVVVSAQNKDWLGKNVSDLPSALTTIYNASPDDGAFEVDIDGEIWLAVVEETNMGWKIVVLQERSEIFADAMQITLSILLVGLIILVAMAGVAWVVSNTIVRPLVVLADASQKVADGNLTAIPSDERPFAGELGVLHKALKGMVVNLGKLIASAHQESENAAQESENAKVATREAELARTVTEEKHKEMLVMAGKLETVAQVVSSATTQLFAQIQQSGKGAEHQATMAAETATAMEEMSVTGLEVAKNAALASDVSAQTRLKAEEGAEVVSHSVKSVQAVQQESLKLKEGMVELSQHAQSINQIMNVISDIADQTNLLALNAAIEAARAGEAGRGFAVVADEVRKLAEKTMTSTTDVGNVIKAIQSSSTKSMELVDSSVALIEETAEYAERSGKSLQEIVHMVDQTAAQVEGIAAASEEQSSASEQITRSVHQMNTIASDTSRAMEEATLAVSDLTQQAQGLTQLTEAMRRG